MGTLRPGKEKASPAGRDSLSVASGRLSLLSHLTALFTHAHLGAVYSGQHGVSLSAIEHLLAAEEPVVTLCIWALLSEHWGSSRGPVSRRHLPEPWEVGSHLPHFADERLSDVKITQLKHG